MLLGDSPELGLHEPESNQLTSGIAKPALYQ